MPIRRARRIFRKTAPGPRRGAAKRGLLAGGLSILIAAAGVWTALHAWPPQPPAPKRMAAATITATAPEVAVVDGDTLRLKDTVLRLQGVAAPARGNTCHPRDGAAYDCGAAASQALAGIVRGQDLACRFAGRDAQGVAQADCRAGGTDVNRAIVAAGWARAAGSGALESVEDAARAAGRGAWRGVAGDTF